jgi:hypothetical protein
MNGGVIKSCTSKSHHNLVNTTNFRDCVFLVFGFSFLVSSFLSAQSADESVSFKPDPQITQI